MAHYKPDPLSPGGYWKRDTLAPDEYQRTSTKLYKWGYWLALHLECETTGEDPLHLWGQRFRSMPPSHTPLTPLTPLTPDQKAFDKAHVAALWTNQRIRWRN